ncbi:MAG TPA: hypothetical protein DD438_07985 [Verrucomicrobiales bacterium]|nr:hypothetical protein [Verrucomicrobiales bacterium]HCQ37594.1 hypothetical protein [Verrucomicrobiales bacterium]
MQRFTIHFLTLMFLMSGGKLMADREGDAERVIRRWLSTNAGVEALEVEFTQIRKLTSLKSMIRQDGILWMDRRGGTRFRWQTGNPPRTIVTRVKDELLVMRPRSLQYEKAPAGESKNSMAILAGGFPRNWEEFEQKYDLLGVKSQDGTSRINVQPKGQLARGVRVLTFVTRSAKGVLQSIDLTLRDGSSQQIVFDRVVTNPQLSDKIFYPDLTGYRATKFK